MKKISFLIWIAFLTITTCYAQDNWKKQHSPSDDAWKSVEQHFKFNNGDEPKSLDPGVITGLLEFRLVASLFEGLTTQDPETLQARPGVAESWQVSEDGLTYTFKIRPNAQWSDGTPINSNTFVNCWERVLNPKMTAPYNYQLFPIANAEEYATGKENDFSKVGVKALEALVLQVKLKQPCPYFLELTAFPTLYPVPLHVIEKHQEKWINPGNMVNNGAFVLSEWHHREKIVMVKNKKYWDADFVKLETITAYPMDKMETALKKYMNKEIHWMPELPLSKIAEIRQLADYYQSESLSTAFYRFNVEKPPFDKGEVRKAFLMATDRKSLTQYVLNGVNIPATWFSPPAAGYQHVKGIEYNPVAAKKLLESTGLHQADKPMEIELLFNKSENNQKIAEYIAENWKTNLGVKVTLRNAEWKTYLADMTKRNYQMCRGSWIADYNDPNSFFDLFVTNGGNNRTGWSNTQYDQLLAQAQQERDQEKRLKIFQEMETILVEIDPPILPLYIGVNQGLLSEKVNGWYENILSAHPMKYIWLE